MGATTIKLSTKLPQAQDDTGMVLEDAVVSLDVLDNDLGGNSTSIYSLNQDDLTIETGGGSETLVSGAVISIVNGEILYDTTNLIADIPEGKVFTETFFYTMRLGNGTIVRAEVTVEITGVGGGGLPTIIGDDDMNNILFGDAGTVSTARAEGDSQR